MHPRIPLLRSARSIFGWGKSGKGGKTDKKLLKVCAEDKECKETDFQTKQPEESEEVKCETKPQAQEDEKSLVLAEQEDNDVAEEEDPPSQMVVVDNIDEDYDPKIVIVGAGLSGLSAANRLYTMGFENITILEASHRAGGRVESTMFGDAIVSLGGVWNEGPPSKGSNDFMDNPILYQAYKLGMIRNEKQLPLARSLIQECDGKTLPLPASFLALSNMQRILGVGERLRSAVSYVEQGMTEKYIGMMMRQELRNTPEGMKSVGARVYTALTMLATGNAYTSADSFGPYASVPGSGIKVPLGCTGVLAPLLDNVSKYIKTCKEVKSVRWGALDGLNGQRILLRTADGSEYSADFVIYTTSLGTLKLNHQVTFCPNLPSDKVNSINEIPFDSKNKIFIHFEKGFSNWREEKIVWYLNEDETKCLDGPLKGLREVKEISEKVLQVTLYGKGAQEAEIVSDEELFQMISKYIMMRTCLRIPRPLDMLKTKWTSNKFYLGARPSRGSAPLAKPLPCSGSPEPPVVFFAGDGTSVENPGTLLGAFTSGIREADKLMSHLPGNKNSVATEDCLQLKASAAS